MNDYGYVNRYDNPPDYEDSPCRQCDKYKTCQYRPQKKCLKWFTEWSERFREVKKLYTPKKQSKVFKEAQ